MKSYGIFDLQCKKCNKIYEKVDMSTEFPPWWNLCRECGALITPDNRIGEPYVNS